MEIKLSNGSFVEINEKKYGNGKKAIIFLHGGPRATKDSLEKYFLDLEKEFTLLFFDQIACGENEKEYKYEYKYKVLYELEVIEAIKKIWI